MVPAKKRRLIPEDVHFIFLLPRPTCSSNNTSGPRTKMAQPQVDRPTADQVTNLVSRESERIRLCLDYHPCLPRSREESRKSASLSPVRSRPETSIIMPYRASSFAGIKWVQHCESHADFTPAVVPHLRYPQDQCRAYEGAQAQRLHTGICSLL